MRVLYAIPRYGEQFMSGETHGEVVRELRARGVAVDVLSFTSRSGHSGPVGWSSGFGSEQVYRHPQNRNLPLRLASRALRPLLHYDHLLSMVDGLRQVTRARRYDLLHIEGAYPLGVAAMLTQRQHRLPYVITTTGGDMFTLPELNYGYRQYRVPRWLIAQALRRASWIRANSALVGRMVAGLGVAPAQITVLPVSIGDACYPPAEQTLDGFRAAARATLVAQFGWDERPIIGLVGRLFSLKAPELLLEALPLIRQQLGPVRACIIGPSRTDPQVGDYRDFLENTAQRLGVAEDCIFTGSVPNHTISQYLAACDLLAVPSRLEGLNRVVIEAAAVGTPSVVSTGAGAAELIATYGCGLIVPRNNVAALAHACTRILSNPGTQIQFRTAALELAEHLRAAGVARQLETIYHRTLEAHG